MTVGSSSTGKATLFSAAQPNSPTFVSQEQFEWSLHYNLLFHPTGMVSPDPFFFCPHLTNYLKDQDEGQSWYEGALAAGLIIPFVRDLKLAGYHALWAEMYRSGLQGHLDRKSVV
jgi:hypothetical protein